MSAGVAFAQIVAVVCGHQRKRELPGQAHKPLICYSLFRDPVCLDFQVKITRLKYLRILLSRPFCTLMLISDQKRGNFPLEAARKGYRAPRCAA